MSLYQVVMECRVRKLVTVEAEDVNEALERADNAEWLDEQDIDLIDWERDGMMEWVE